jgi:hypothetical protein
VAKTLVSKDTAKQVRADMLEFGEFLVSIEEQVYGKEAGSKNKEFHGDINRLRKQVRKDQSA